MMRFHYAYVRPWGDTNIIITEVCRDDDCTERFHLAIQDTPPRHAADCKCSNCYIPRV